jgi:hypothetical protein
MNPWMMDPRTEQADEDAFQADRAQRRGNLAEARARYQAAAKGFASVALSVPAELPNTRGDLAIAAVASYGRAGDFGMAAEIARRVLAESGALTEHGRQELWKLLREYTALQERAPVPAGSHGLNHAASRSEMLREQVRKDAKMEPRAA